MKVLMLLATLFLAGCGYFSGYIPYDGVAKYPFLEEQVRCWPVQRSPFGGLYTARDCDLLVGITNPYDIAILVHFQSGLYERNEIIPPHTTRYFMGDPNRRNPYESRSRILSWRVAP